MRVLHVPFLFYPDPVGGTEIYVDQLCRALAPLGVQAAVAAPAAQATEYTHNGIAVHRYAIGSTIRHLRELYAAEGDPQAASGFAAILDREQPQIVHFHAFTRAIGLDAIAAARARGIRTLFTYHLPGVSCQQGSLLRWGRSVCDGRLDSRRCAACSLHHRGMPQALSMAAGYLPAAIGRRIGAGGRSGGLWTALQMRALLEERHQGVQALFAQVDRVVVLCDWARALLLRLGVDPARLLLSRHGIPLPTTLPAAPAEPADRPLRVAFIGRMYPIKGPHILIQALRNTPAAIQLDLYGQSQDAAGEAYLRSLHELAGDDGRIRFLGALPNAQIVPRLATYDLLAVPSQWLETGPLVVLEAFAAGVPVLGSDLGGIGELVRDGENGQLVTHDRVEAWSAALSRLDADRDLRTRLRAGVRPPRPVAAVAAEMSELYSTLIGQTKPTMMEKV